MISLSLTGQKPEKSLAWDNIFLRENMLILGAFIIYTLCAVIFFIYNDLLEYASFRMYKLPYFAIFAVILFIKALAFILSQKLRHGYFLDRQNFLPDLRAGWLNWKVGFSIFLPLVGVSFMMSIFGSVKTLFPMVNPYFLDVPLMEIDRFLHFGFQPWELTHGIFGSPFATEVIDFFYQLWFILLMAFTVWMIANHKLGRIRARFLLSYIFTWGLLGTLLAVILPAAGPCFYGNFVAGSDVYAPLMDRLNEISGLIKADGGQEGLYALLNQGLLWAFYTDDHIGLGSGITAMPSMHVSFAMLLYLTMREMNRTGGYLALFYLIVIQIGSVHLGWHYAVDGYVSILLTWLIWRACGWMVGRIYETKEQSAWQTT